MSGVRRWVLAAGSHLTTATGVLASIEGMVDAPTVVVLFTDHEAALAAARDEGYEAGLRARWGEREDRAFNAALDAAIGTGLAVEDVNRVLDLRKSTSQPEAQS